MRACFPKQAPHIITYRDYQHFDEFLFRNELLVVLYNDINAKIDYDIFEKNCMRVLNRHDPLKEKYVRANNSHFINKTL